MQSASLLVPLLDCMTSDASAVDSVTRISASARIHIYEQADGTQHRIAHVCGCLTAREACCFGVGRHSHAGWDA